MYINIIVLFIILFALFCIIWKKEFVRNLFYSTWFIFTLWANIPCFISISQKELVGNKILFLPFSSYNKFGILYVIFSNILLGFILYFQSLFSNQSLYSYRKIKKIYDSFGNDATNLYVIGKDLDFLYKKGFKKQTERILHLGPNCTLICEATNDIRLIHLYNKVQSENVVVKHYKNKSDITNLKGQIKTCQNGNKTAVFTSKVNNKYSLLIIENQFLISSILDCYNKL